MNIDYEKIEEIYGEEVIELIKDNFSEVKENIKYLISLGFQDVEDIFERYPHMFLCGKNKFKERIDNLIKKVGNNYVEELENNMDLWEDA